MAHKHLLLVVASLMAGGIACGRLPELVQVDAGQLDTEPMDAGEMGSVPDAGRDAGRGDAGADAGREDAGRADAGEDAGLDAGEEDAGPDGGYNGTPIEIPEQAPYDTWTWVPIPNTYCANGTPTGLGINPHQGSNKLMIFLAGGGMCFDYTTCFVAKSASNLDGFTSAELQGDKAELDNQPGGLNRADAANIFKDYNYVVLPYCTGDIFAGTQETIYYDTSGGPHPVYHVGHNDILAYLQVLVPTFAATQDQVIFSGSSAGGYGALLNYDWVRTAFAPTPVYLIDDSGPPMRNPYLATSLLSTIWSAWGMEKAVPPGCTTCSVSNGISSVVDYLTSDPSFRGVLLSSEQDNVIKDFLTLGNPLMQFGWYFQIGLNDLYTNVIYPSGPGQFRVYFVQSSQHVWFVFNDPGEVTSGGVTLQQFMTNLVTLDAGFDNVLP